MGLGATTESLAATEEAETRDEGPAAAEPAAKAARSDRHRFRGTGSASRRQEQELPPAINADRASRAASNDTATMDETALDKMKK